LSFETHFYNEIICSVLELIKIALQYAVSIDFWQYKVEVEVMDIISEDKLAWI